MVDKLGNVEAESNELNVDILELNDVKWVGAGKTDNQEIYLLFKVYPEQGYGTTDFSDKIAWSVMDLKPVGNRVM